MRLETIELDETHCFSSTFLKYINGNENLKSFYNKPPLLESFRQQIQEKEFSKNKRATLVEVLKEQYSTVNTVTETQQNIESLLEENTFTITTGHQLNIFTGPLYFIYKIVTVINACKQLKEQYPNYNFVPVYWMASEDHDFEEINHFRLEGKKYSWNTDQKGAVGRFNPKAIKDILDQIPGNNTVFEKAYLEHDTLADAARYYVNELFKNTGLVILNADDRRLKKSFAEVMQEDIFKHTHRPVVEATNQQLEAAGYSTQVYVRDINFFYLENGLRERIVKTDGGFEVLNTSIQFSEKELADAITAAPEKFSPNVILRPLYQEWILPNLAYIGGPAEVVYWLQLKGVFDYYKVAFPILMPRNFAMVVDRNNVRKLNKLGFKLKKWFMPTEDIINECVEQDTGHDISYSERILELRESYRLAKEQAKMVDASLAQHIEAIEAKSVKLLDKAEKKLVRAEKRHHDDKIEQVVAVKNKLFPNNGLQERTENFLNFYQNNPEFIKKLLINFNPFDFKFNVLFEE